MDQKTCRRWQLQDVLHAVGEQGITQSDYGDEDGDGTQARIEPKEPKLRGLLTTLDLEAKTGLPKCISANEQMYIFRAIAAGMRTPRGGECTLQWVPPITCSTQMRKSLEDRQVHENDDRRYRTVIFRSQPYFAKRPSQDNVKVWIEEDAGRKLYFAKYVSIYCQVRPITLLYSLQCVFMIVHSTYRCMAFFQDDAGEHFVCLRWYAEPAKLPPGCLLELTALNLV
jgi:hypothetical protein